MRLQPFHTGRGRRGMILLIVLTMLTLFAIAGLTFVLYAESAAESARINRSAESFSVTSLPDMDPNQSFSLFMGQLVYGVPDDTTGVFSALRGHSLAETMYGSWDAYGPLTVPPPATPLTPSDVSYNGTGRLHETTQVLGQDPYNLVNYTYFTNDGINPAPNSVLRDPSRPGTRGNLAAGRTTYTGGQNAPYTYPDRNSMFLASMRASDGTVLVPSYYRPGTGLDLNPDPSPATNPNWNSPSSAAALKYMTLRPRPADMGPGFPPPASTAGDVKNLTGMPGGNDSIWIDINAPVLTTASGLRYKMLVAPLILDLDNRINLNVVGNILASNNLHASNQGWGPWEINMSKVLNANATEWNQLFINNNGRYGPGHQPLSIFVPLGPTPHVYAQGDLNGTLDPAPNTITGLYTLPKAGSIGAFPTYPAGYSNGSQETTNSGGAKIHPMFFNPFTAPNGNILFTIQNNASLLWAGPAFGTTDLHTLCPTNYLATDPQTSRRINQTTVLSMDLDRGGAAPYIFPNASDTSYAISYNPANGAYSYGTPVASPLVASFPPLTSRGATPANSEFDPNTWQSVLARTLPRIDMDRQLAVYPASGVQPPDRQQFAMDIYTRLVAATGMTAANSSLGSMNPPSPAQYTSLRWLAQLSANIVDYIDTDDVMTQFQWTTTPTAPDTGFVFGTELPKLVLNEVYLEYDNGSGDPAMIPDPNNVGKMIKVARKPYQMNVWAELLNPLPSTAETAPNPANNATLQDNTGKAVYQLVMSKPNSQASTYGAGYPTGLRRPENIVGDPDNSSQPYMPSGTYVTGGGTQVLTAVNNWGAGAVTVAPMGQNFGNGSSATAGFFVVGPSNQSTPTSGLPAATFQSPSMTYTVNYDPATEPTANAPVAPTLLLQRLANPNLPYNGVPGAGYNPYVTVDYVDLNPLATGGPPAINPAINDARAFNSTGPIGNAPTQPYTNFFSYGRNEPYASLCVNNVNNQWQPQQRNPASKTGPQNSFFQQNVNVNTAGPNDATQANFTVPTTYPAFDWLVHLDRPLISPIELLHVSAFKPQELTQQFIDAAGKKLDPSGHGHYAPWTETTGSARLYRLLEFVKTKNPTPGIVNGGRVPGKININTLDSTSEEVFLALCDTQAGNTFAYNNGAYVGDGAGTYVDQVFKAIMAARTLGGVPGPNDRPFWGMAQGTYQAGDTQYPNGSSVSNTLLAAASTGGPPGATHPYQNLELLNKIYNNLTTRSNTFAVWLTVGFFQVTNDVVQPNQLGPEINLLQGKNIRHHMFAIVDRTQLQTFSTTSTNAITIPAGQTQVSAPVTLAANPINDPRTGRNWQVQQNSTLVYDPGAANEETVVVQAGMTATFTQNHGAGAKVISRGNPGPWNLSGTLKYDPTQDTSVVPYFKIID